MINRDDLIIKIFRSISDKMSKEDKIRNEILRKNQSKIDSFVHNCLKSGETDLNLAQSLERFFINNPTII